MLIRGCDYDIAIIDFGSAGFAAAQRINETGYRTLLWAEDAPSVFYLRHSGRSLILPIFLRLQDKVTIVKNTLAVHSAFSVPYIACGDLSFVQHLENTAFVKGDTQITRSTALLSRN